MQKWRTPVKINNCRKSCEFILIDDLNICNPLRFAVITRPFAFFKTGSNKSSFWKPSWPIHQAVTDILASLHRTASALWCHPTSSKRLQPYLCCCLPYVISFVPSVVMQNIRLFQNIDCIWLGLSFIGRKILGKIDFEKIPQNGQKVKGSPLLHFRWKGSPLLHFYEKGPPPFCTSGEKDPPLCFSTNTPRYGSEPPPPKHANQQSYIFSVYFIFFHWFLLKHILKYYLITIASNYFIFSIQKEQKHEQVQEHTTYVRVRTEIMNFNDPGVTTPYMQRIPATCLATKLRCI